MCWEDISRNTWRVTPAALQRPSCRRTLVSISCSVKRATPAAPSPASRPASRLWQARGRSSAPKPTKDHRHWAPPPLCLSFPLRRAEAGVGCPLDSLKGLSESNCGRVWLLFSCRGLTRQGVREYRKLTDGVQALSRWCVLYTLLEAFDLLSGWWTLHLLGFFFFFFPFAVILDYCKKTLI